MPFNRLISVLALVLAVLAGGARMAAAQNAVTSADIQRLEDSIYDASRDVDAGADAQRGERGPARRGARRRARRNDLSAGSRSGRTRRSRAASTPRLRDRIDDIRSARARRAPRGRVTSRHVGNRRGSELGCGRPGRHRVRRPAADPAQLRDRAGRGSVRSDDDGRLARTASACSIPAGSVMRGVVSSVNKAGRLERQGQADAGVRSDHDQRPKPIRSAPRSPRRSRAKASAARPARSARAPASARSSAASSAASRARSPAS